MSQSKHTQGKWEINESKENGMCLDISADSPEEGFKVYIAEIYNNDEGEANARLIASAPELDGYKRYIEDNLDRIDQGGWVPVCFAEYCECEYKMETGE